MKQVIFITVSMMIVAMLLFVGKMPRVHGEEAATRTQAAKQMKDGNWKDAYEEYASLALDPQTDPKQVSMDLMNAIACLRRLNRVDEIDDLREKTIAAHADNWRLVSTAARSYMEDTHYGFIVAGKFYRGDHRGGGRWVNSLERDRVRALQLYLQAYPLADRDAARSDVSDFYLHFSEALQAGRTDNGAWRLQYLTDISTLPDYEEGGYYAPGGRRGAPVKADGTPVYYTVPASWNAAANDGERWRWTLNRAMQVDPTQTQRVQFTFASFLLDQFGVQTMAEYGASLNDDTVDNESGPYAVQTLSDDETIARLATGIKRFTLPEEFRYIRIFQQLANGTGDYAKSAVRTLAGIYENRRQYDKAASYWKRVGETKQVEQILGNWGTFESVGTQPAGTAPTVDFRFRNAKQVSLVARQIDVEKLLGDVQKYITSRPKQLEWEQINIEDIGYRLLDKNQAQYLTKTVVKWNVDLQPRANHFDTRTTITTPLRKGGAYLLTATLQNGNTSNIVLWVADLAIVKKPLDNGMYYYIADAVTGQPVAKANIEFFGYNQNWVNEAQNRGGHYDISTRHFAIYSSQTGEIIVNKDQQPTDYSWIVTARANGRLAYLGFTRAWYGRQYDEAYNQVKTFVITDRPVYRPGQPVKFKFWVNTAKYD
ncbi:MAG TPA: alpha-2-macroglobulin, partial [Armatimonadota bacterium]|nr:alpha-2-macroglobulin [Armatimonadota bacterium]